jgi:putative transposase
MPKGTQVTVRTLGHNAKHALAGALDITTGQLWYCRGVRQTHARFRDLLEVLDTYSPGPQDQRLSVVVENGNSHTAKAVGRWLASHPRVQVLFGPLYCPRAHPIARAFGDGHDPGPRNHTRTHVEALGEDVEQHCLKHGPWCSPLSHLSSEPEGTMAMETPAAEALGQAAA